MSRIYLRYRHWLFRLPVLRTYNAICLGRFILFKAGKDEISERLLRHEMIHQEQISRVGMVRFYLVYLRDYGLNLWRYRSHWQAYRNIPFEREAYEREGENARH